jgi:hypothetical protein
MVNKNISPVIRSAIKIIENTIEDIKITVLDSEMKKSLPTEKYPEGIPGVNIQINLDGDYREIFMSSRLAESMHSIYGDEVAKEFILPLFRNQISKNNEKI